MRPLEVGGMGEGELRELGRVAPAIKALMQVGGCGGGWRGFRVGVAVEGLGVGVGAVELQIGLRALPHTTPHHTQQTTSAPPFTTSNSAPPPPHPIDPHRPRGTL